MKVFNNVITNGSGTSVFVFDSEHKTHSYNYKGMNDTEIPALAFFVNNVFEEVTLFLSGDLPSNQNYVGFLCVNGASGPVNIKVNFNGNTIGAITSASPAPYVLYLDTMGLSLKTFTLD